MNFFLSLTLISFVSTNLVIETPFSHTSSTGLEDDIQFLFRWKPSNSLDIEDNSNKDVEIVNLKTNRNERYKCAIPVLKSGDNVNFNLKETSEQELTRVQTFNLLADFHQKKLCSYRIESYWIYELCHGNFVRQYHETKSAGKIVVNGEYFLGYFDSNKQKPDYLRQSDDRFVPNISWKNLNGEKIPTYAVKYTDGTPCEILKDAKREITIFYACEEFGNDNIIAFEEISSCNYEMIVVSKWICSNLAYKIPEKNYPSIYCYSIENSPIKPNELIKIEEEQSILKADKNKVQMTNKAGDTFIIHYKTNDDDVFQKEEVKIPIEKEILKESITNQPAVNDDAQREIVKSFLNGDSCLNGGSGWWKFEICFGKHVVQYHDDEQTKKRQTISLGLWNLQNHLNWINARPAKRPIEKKSERIYSSLLYSEGSKCDETNKNRFVEVKFKCIKNKSQAGAISLYLVEPTMCEYLLAIESAWLCDYIESVDQNGLLNKP
ncbi:unnamed protein product [Brachionus calyciflorus]|uniref:Endoplasmic reticulum lectin 1 n=1 Tax=Brachionus calyciflorus TaxID=104777 RepID=A0A813YUC5_9BILA|nr:unnamed protein product [Brachionus calyciflorus]